MADYEGVLLSVNSESSQQLCKMSSENMYGLLPVGRKPLLYYSVMAMLSVGVERIHIVCSSFERGEYESYLNKEAWTANQQKDSAFLLLHKPTRSPTFNFVTYELEEFLRPLSLLNLLSKVRLHLLGDVFIVSEIGLILENGLRSLAETFHSTGSYLTMLFTPEVVKPQTKEEAANCKLPCPYNLFVLPNTTAVRRDWRWLLYRMSEVHASSSRRRRPNEFVAFDDSIGQSGSNEMDVFVNMIDCHCFFVRGEMLKCLLDKEKEFDSVEECVMQWVNDDQSSDIRGDSHNHSSDHRGDKQQKDLFEEFIAPKPSGRRIHAHICLNALCLPVSCLPHYLYANQRVLQAPRRYLLDQQPLMVGGLTLEGSVKASVVEEDVKVYKQAIVNNCVVAKGCQIDESAKVQNSVLLEGVQIGAGAVITNSVIGASVVVAKEAIVNHCFAYREANVSAYKEHHQSILEPV